MGGKRVEAGLEQLLDEPRHGGLVVGLVDRESPLGESVLEIAPQLLEISLTLVERALDAGEAAGAKFADGDVEAPLVRVVPVVNHGAEYDMLAVTDVHGAWGILRGSRVTR
jgi:hypothetical protein